MTPRRRRLPPPPQPRTAAHAARHSMSPRAPGFGQQRRFVATTRRISPGALTLFKVHRSFLVAMTAALIGIATAKVTDDPAPPTSYTPVARANTAG